MYFRPETQQIFQTHSEIRAAFPGVSFPSVMTDEDIASVGVHTVTQVQPPAFDRLTQKAVELQPAQIDGVLTQKWEVVALDAEAVASNIASHKVALHSSINARRDALEEAGFPYLGKQLDSDSRSVQRINTAMQAAQVALAAGQPFSIGWTCADDTTLTLDAQGMLGVPVALAKHANTIHRHARELKTLVNAAQTSAELESIEINADWPR